jgi:NAD(P)H-dependent FMN reductase
MANVVTAAAGSNLTFIENRILATVQSRYRRFRQIPKAWSEFRSAVKSVEGLLFFSPEYNRSIPGALKNAIDIGSRQAEKLFDEQNALVNDKMQERIANFLKSFEAWVNLIHSGFTS